MSRTPMESEAFPSGLAGESGAAGMLRIRRGEQVRWIWPVHLPGWLALGWQVASRGPDPLGPDPLGPDPEGQPSTSGAALPVVLTDDLDPNDAQGASDTATPEPSARSTRRGRRRPAPEPLTPEVAPAASEDATPEDSVPAGIDDLLLDPLP